MKIKNFFTKAITSTLLLGALGLSSPVQAGEAEFGFGIKDPIDGDLTGTALTTQTTYTFNNSLRIGFNVDYTELTNTSNTAAIGPFVGVEVFDNGAIDFGGNIYTGGQNYDNEWFVQGSWDIALNEQYTLTALGQKGLGNDKALRAGFLIKTGF